MKTISRTLIALLATAAVAGVGASAARAATGPTLGDGVAPGLFPAAHLAAFSPAPAGSVGDFSNTGPCATGPAGGGPAIGGDTGGTTATVCSESGLTFVGPAIGQVASVIGPTIIGSTVVGGVVVSAGDGSAG